MPLTEAQKFFNKEGKIDSLNLLVNEPYNVGNIQIKLKEIFELDYSVWTWKDISGTFLNRTGGKFDIKTVASSDLNNNVGSL